MIQRPAKGRVLRLQHERGRLQRTRESSAIAFGHLLGAKDGDVAFAEEMVEGANLQGRRHRLIGEHQIETVDRELSQVPFGLIDP